MSNDRDAVESYEELECTVRHRKEKKELQAHIQQLKHSVPKGDKKKKKEITTQIALLEAEIESRHQKELSDLKQSVTNVNSMSDSVDQLTLQPEDNGEVSNEADVTPEDSITTTTKKKATKADRRKEKKIQKAQEREERIKEQDMMNEHGIRNIEAEKIRSILQSRGLVIHEIPSDGNCLFSAIENQLGQQSVQSSVETLRKQTAEYMRQHCDDFLPFLIKEDSGDVYSPEEFEKYCNDLERTSLWGGQAEIRALAEVLTVPIEIIQADGPVLTLGQQFSGKPLTITYHRYQYGLGEHYNSVKPANSAVQFNTNKNS